MDEGEVLQAPPGEVTLLFVSFDAALENAALPVVSDAQAPVAGIKRKKITIVSTY